jgi:hypothetical protein
MNGAARNEGGLLAHCRLLRVSRYVRFAIRSLTCSARVKHEGDGDIPVFSMSTPSLC